MLCQILVGTQNKWTQTGHSGCLPARSLLLSEELRLARKKVLMKGPSRGNEYNKVAKKKNIRMWWERQGGLLEKEVEKSSEGRVGLE